MSLQPNQTLPTTFIKRYEGLLTQTSTNAPTMEELQNTLDNTITPTYTATGRYTFTFATPIPNRNVAITMPNCTTVGRIPAIERTLSGDNITAFILDITAHDGNNYDGALTKNKLTVELYNLETE